MLLGEGWVANYVGFYIFGIPGPDNLFRVDFGPVRDLRRVSRITIASTPYNRDEPPLVWVVIQKELFSSLHNSSSLALYSGKWE